MPFEEKLTWVSAVVSIAVPVVYFATIVGRLGGVPVSDIAYQRPMLIAIGASIVLTILGAILAAIGTHLSAEITGRGSPKDIDKKDERDIMINRSGVRAGYYVACVGALGTLALTMLKSEYFWIANALYLSFVISSLVSSAVKLVAYRRGLSAW